LSERVGPLKILSLFDCIPNYFFAIISCLCNKVSFLRWISCYGPFFKLRQQRPPAANVGLRCQDEVAWSFTSPLETNEVHEVHTVCCTGWARISKNSKVTRFLFFYNYYLESLDVRLYLFLDLLLHILHIYGIRW
jgi:hypothetical protein